MKKILFAMLAAVVLVGCGAGEKKAEAATEDKQAVDAAPVEKVAEEPVPFAVADKIVNKMIDATAEIEATKNMEEFNAVMQEYQNEMEKFAEENMAEAEKLQEAVNNGDEAALEAMKKTEEAAVRFGEVVNKKMEEFFNVQ